MSTLTIIISIVAVVIIGFIIFGFAGLNKVKGLTIGKVDLTQIKDGIYPGEFKGYRWSNRVEVTVNNHQIVGLKITKNMMIPIGDISKNLFDQILQKQSLQVDVVSNATVTTKAYLKAIEKALTKAGK